MLFTSHFGSFRGFDEKIFIFFKFSLELCFIEPLNEDGVHVGELSYLHLSDLLDFWGPHSQRICPTLLIDFFVVRIPLVLDEVGATSLDSPDIFQVFLLEVDQVCNGSTTYIYGQN